MNTHGHNHILTLEQFRALARPTSTHIDKDVVETYINECEDVYITPAIGVSLMGDLISYVNATNPGTNDTYDHLLDGIDYEPSNTCGCVGGDGMKVCYGLRKALSYFVYAKMLLDDGLTITRSGNIQHNDEYGARMAQQQRINRYNDVLSTAQMYLESVLQYIKSEVNTEQPPIKQYGTRIKAIGD